MNTEISTPLKHLNEELAGSVLDCNEINTRAQAFLVRQQFEVLQTCLEAGNKQLKGLLDAKNPTELILQQTQVFSDLVSELTDQAREILDIQRQARVELGLCLEDVLEAAQTETEAAA